MGKIPMNFRLEENLVEQLKKIADHENRSLTNLIETDRSLQLHTKNLIVANSIAEC